MAKGAEQGRLIAARNKKAFRDFFILDRYEAGICLMGSEVKSIREHKVNLKDSYARIREGQLYLYNMHVSPYRKSRVQDLEPKRTRKLLMHRREIDRLAGLTARPGSRTWSPKGPANCSCTEERSTAWRER